MLSPRLAPLAGVAALAIGAATLGASPALAHVAFNLGIGVPGPVYAAPPPVVYAPAPVYPVPAPVYTAPAPVYAYPPAVVTGVPFYGSFGFGYGGWRGGRYGRYR